MKSIVSVLAESPFYFTMPLSDRYRLVRRLLDREQAIDLSGYQISISAFLQVQGADLPRSPSLGNANLWPGPWRFH